MTELKFLEEFNNIHTSLLRYGVNSWNIKTIETDLLALFKQYQSYQNANEPILADFPKKEEATETQDTEVA